MCNIDRYYFKCADCLRTMTIEGQVHPTLCHCGGRIIRMGKVIGMNKYGRLEQACACDARCTHASGPNCDCSCGGENHGKGTLIDIAIIDGTVRVTTPCEAKEAQIGNEWREALAAARARLEAKHGTSLEAIKRGIRIPYDLWSEANNANNAFFRIQGSKIHKTRMEKMNKFLT